MRPYFDLRKVTKSGDNMYNFILLDTESGAVWQPQWSYDANKRGILRIYEF